MRTATLLLLASLVLTPFVPAADAAPVCQALSRTQSVAGTTVTVVTSSCYDSYVGFGYSYESYANVTRVTVTSAATAQTAIVDDAAYWSVYTQGSDETTYRYHGYSASVVDASYQGVAAGASDNQSQYPTECYENAGVGHGHAMGPVSGYSSNGVRMGDGPGALAPCTSTDVQQTLP